MDARTLYANRKREIDALLDWLSTEVDQHERYAKEEGGPNYAHCGDLGRTRELLIRTLSFLAQMEPEDIENALDDAAAGREQADDHTSD